jgi:adenylate kinase family enzyme
MSARCRVVFLVGSPLSGKSTFAGELAKISKRGVFSTGEYARTLGMGVESSIQSQDLSMDFNGRINDKVQEILWSDNTWIVDGWPRSREQIDVLLRYSKETGKADYLVISCYLNPVLILARARDRNRDGNDSESVVTGRIVASMKLSRMLSELLVDGCTVDMGNEGQKEEIKIWLAEELKGYYE